MERRRIIKGVDVPRSITRGRDGSVEDEEREKVYKHPERVGTSREGSKIEEYSNI